MISKPIPANSFYHTCRYICQKQGVEVLLVEGVRGHNYKVMAEDFLRQQQLRPSKKMACFHSILSFHPSEKPSDETMKEIAKKYLEQLNIVNTQYAISKHTDKAHLHLHIVANMVNNEGKAISDSWIGLRGKKIAQQLTLKYELVQAISKDLSLTHLEALSASEANKYKIYIAISENLSHCRTMKDLEEKLLNLGIQTQYKYKGQTLETQGVSFKIGNDCFKGSKIDRKFSLGNLEYTLQLQREQLLLRQLQLNAVKENYPEQNIRRTEILKEYFEKHQEAPITKELQKIFEILLKPEYQEQNISYELLRESRRKKQRHKGLSI